MLSSYKHFLDCDNYCDGPASLYDETGAERVEGYPAGISSGCHQYLPIQTLGDSIQTEMVEQ